MEHAWIAGQPAALDAAIQEAAKLVASSRCALIAGLGTDVAGARAAIELAERIGAIVDHMHSEIVLRDLDVLRSSGTFATTLTEARVRGDLLLLIGPGLGKAWLELPPQLFAAPQPSERGSPKARRDSAASAPRAIGQFQLLPWSSKGHRPQIPGACCGAARAAGRRTYRQESLAFHRALLTKWQAP